MPSHTRHRHAPGAHGCEDACAWRHCHETSCYSPAEKKRCWNIDTASNKSTKIDHLVSTVTDSLTLCGQGIVLSIPSASLRFCILVLLRVRKNCVLPTGHNTCPNSLYLILFIQVVTGSSQHNASGLTDPDCIPLLILQLPSFLGSLYVVRLSPIHVPNITEMSNGSHPVDKSFTMISIQWSSQCRTESQCSKVINLSRY